MKKDKVINLVDKRNEKELPSNLIKVKSKKTVRIPILDKIYEVDGELMYELKSDTTPRKWKDYSLDDFN